MKTSFKKFISGILAFTLTFGMSAVGSAYAADSEEEEEKTTTENGTLSVISANVAGLPIPSKFDSEGKVVPKTQKVMGQLLNESGIDIICVQEDFQYHAILAAQMTNYPYQTYTSGGVPVGDGLNIYSKYPIYNIERVTWEVFNGILDAANDGLTPKGFIKCTVDFNGMLIDLYDIHCDAYSSENDTKAKYAQNKQLAAYIEKNSADRPVVITGDTNVYMHSEVGAGLYEIYIDGAGFDDAWTMYCHDGEYFTEPITYQEQLELMDRYGGHSWGRWDSVERVFYRGNSNVNFEVTDFRYTDYNKLAGQPLTDHAVMICDLKVTSNDYVRPEIELKKEVRKPAVEQFTHGVKMFARCLNLIFTDLFAKIKSGEIKIPKN